MHQWHCLAAALVCGVDAANALDLIAEPLDAERRGLACGEEINDAAAPRNLAATANERDGLVAECNGPRRDGVKGNAIPCAQEQRLGAQVGERDRWLRHRQQ